MRTVRGSLLARVASAAIVGMTVALAVAGCGSDGPGAGPGPTLGPTPGARPTPTPATATPRLWALATRATAPDQGPSTPRTTVLLVSDDRGESWQVLDGTGLAPTALAIDFVDAVHGVAVGLYAAQRTSDGGRTWTTQLDDPRRPPDAFLRLTGVQLADDGGATVLGSVVGPARDAALGYETWRLPADGATAVPGAVVASPVAAIESMCLTPRGAGVAVGSMVDERTLATWATTLGTDDGGASWRLVEQIERGNGVWSGTACAGERDLWRFGTFSTGPMQLPVLFAAAASHSEDGGVTWDGPAAVGGLGLTSATAGAFADRRTGWVCGADASGPAMLHTSDAGASFVRQTLPEGAGSCTTLAVAADGLGLAGGRGRSPQSGAPQGASLVVTTDGGATWRTAVLPDGLDEIRDVDVTP